LRSSALSFAGSYTEDPIAGFEIRSGVYDFTGEL
jgi:hypothetical protein